MASSAVYIAAGATANITLGKTVVRRGVGMLVPDGANITITGGATDGLTVSAVTGAGIGGWPEKRPLCFQVAEMSRLAAVL